MIKPLSQVALQGFQRAQQGMVKSANAIARQPLTQDQGDVNRSMLELRQHEQAAKANVQALKAADQTIGSLLDEMA